MSELRGRGVRILGMGEINHRRRNVVMKQSTSQRGKT
jgi:hypothetical protein